MKSQMVCADVPAELTKVPNACHCVMADKEPVAEATAATKADESKGKIRKSP